MRSKIIIMWIALLLSEKLNIQFNMNCSCLLEIWQARLKTFFDKLCHETKQDYQTRDQIRGC
jgi:hypothetical protein